MWELYSAMFTRLEAPPKASAATRSGHDPAGDAPGPTAARPHGPSIAGTIRSAWTRVKAEPPDPGPGRSDRTRIVEQGLQRLGLAAAQAAETQAWTSSRERPSRSTSARRRRRRAWPSYPSPDHLENSLRRTDASCRASGPADPSRADAQATASPPAPWRRPKHASVRRRAAASRQLSAPARPGQAFRLFRIAALVAYKRPAQARLPAGPFPKRESHNGPLQDRRPAPTRRTT